jgi:hypothetical protein
MYNCSVSFGQKFYIFLPSNGFLSKAHKFIDSWPGRVKVSEENATSISYSVKKYG